MRIAIVDAMAINWFPGHMNRARREIAKALEKTDVVIELVDARLPRSSRNPLLTRMAGDRPILTLFTKSDLADPEITRQWLDVWQPPRPVALVASDRRSVKRLPDRCRALAPHRGGPGRTLRMLVVGIPNVGKSTLINTLVGRRVAKVGDRPAVTRHPQRVELAADLSLFDSPGVLWPRLDDQRGARRLAASGAIGSNAFEPIQVAAWAARFLAERYRAALARRYGLASELDAILGSAPNTTGTARSAHDEGDASEIALLEAIGRRRGALRTGGHVDLERAADLFLRDLRGGKIAAISYERPDDFPAESESSSSRSR